MDMTRFNPRKIKAVAREAVLRIEKFANEGVCVARENDKVIFVRYVLPGELVRVKIYKETKDYAVGEPLEILEKSTDRVDAPCPYFGLCGGCDFQMLSYEKQIEAKKSLVAETFRRIGKTEIEDRLEAVPSPARLGYRNTETFKVNPLKKLIGFFRKDTKCVVDLKECLLAMPGINRALDSVRSQSLFPRHNFKVRATGDGDTVVHWVLAEHYQDREVVETVTAAGRTVRFKISKDSFFQVNNSVVPLWLEKMISFLDPDGHERIFDLYCGIGLITLFVAPFAGETVGIEISKSSVDDAEHNRKENAGVLGNANVRFVLGAVEEKIGELGPADVVIVDPPRKGMDRDGVDTLFRIAPGKIIYSSCKPATMARDIALLSERYSLESVTLFDMFPQTHHAELLALLTRKHAPSPALPTPSS